MALVSLVLFLTALGALRLFRHASEEVPRILIGLTGIICLLSGLILTPWVVKFVIVLALIGSGRSYKL